MNFTNPESVHADRPWGGSVQPSVGTGAAVNNRRENKTLHSANNQATGGKHVSHHL